MRRILLLIAFVASSLVAFANNNKQYQEKLKEFRQETITYKRVDGKDLDILLFYPEQGKMSKSNNPWVMYVHGGGWAGGDKLNIAGQSTIGTLRHLLDEGYVCAAIDYRLAKAPTTSFESLIDIKDVTRFLINSAKKYKLSRKNYGVWGGSAGGHLSLVAALCSDSSLPAELDLPKTEVSYKFALSLFPFTSCTNAEIFPNSIFADRKLFVRLLGCELDEASAELVTLMSPSELIDKSSCPVLLVHGSVDKTLPLINSEYLYQVGIERGADIELLVIEGAGHSFRGKEISPSLEVMSQHCFDFIKRNIK
ncbi:MAG: alpha/beta hydrolase fold domain-containing protein [Rikenellaceae bacterium]